MLFLGFVNCSALRMFITRNMVPYFFGYKTEFFFHPKQSKRSRSVLEDGSRSLGLLRKGNIGIIAKFHGTDLVI